MSNVAEKEKAVKLWIESENSSKLTSKDVFAKFNDAESQVIAFLILELDFNAVEPSINSIIESISLKDRIVSYHDSILFNVVVEKDIETAVACFNLGSQYSEIGNSIVNEVYLSDQDSGNEGFISEIKEQDIFPNNFDAAVSDIQLMIDDGAAGDPYEETQEKITKGELTLKDSQLDFMFKSLQLPSCSELYTNQKKDFLNLVRRHADNDIKDVPDSVSAIDKIPNVKMTGRLENQNVGFKLDLNFIGSVIGSFETVTAPFSRSLNKSIRKNVKTTLTDGIADLIIDVAVDVVPIPGLHTGLKALKFGMETVKNTFEGMQKNFSFEKEKDIFLEFFKSEHKDAREFLTEFYINKMQEYFLVEFGYKIKDAELGLLSILSQKIVNDSIYVCYSRIEMIKSKRVRDLIEKTSSNQKDTLVYIAVNCFAANEFASPESVNKVFIKKQILEILI